MMMVYNNKKTATTVLTIIIILGLSLVDAYHSLCLDKKDIIASELEACERLLKYTLDGTDRKTVETEIAELRMALDLMS